MNKNLESLKLKIKDLKQKSDVDSYFYKFVKNILNEYVIEAFENIDLDNKKSIENIENSLFQKIQKDFETYENKLKIFTDKKNLEINKSVESLKKQLETSNLKNDVIKNNKFIVAYKKNIDELYNYNNNFSKDIKLIKDNYKKLIKDLKAELLEILNEKIKEIKKIDIVAGTNIEIQKKETKEKTTYKITSKNGGYVINNGSGLTFFTKLKDTPQNYKNQAGKILKVNNLESGIEFGSVNRLEDILNVDLNGLSNNQTIKYNAVNEKWEPANDDACFWTQSGDNIYYNNGNVGIGTTFPSAKLEVIGSTSTIAKGIISYRQSSTGHSLSGASFTSQYMGAGGSAPAVGIKARSLQFITGGSSGALSTSSGFAIEHTLVSPQGFGLTAVDTSFMVNNTATGTPFAALTLQGQTGNVGIGTATPSAKLDILGSSDQVQFGLTANATQTANIFEIQDHLGNDKFNFAFDSETPTLRIGGTQENTKLIMSRSGSSIPVTFLSSGDSLTLSNINFFRVNGILQADSYRSSRILSPNSIPWILESESVNGGTRFSRVGFGVADFTNRNTPKSPLDEYYVTFFGGLTNDHGNVAFQADAGQTADMLTFLDSANNKLGVITVDGHYGIGTDTPTSKLHVDNGDIEVSNPANGLILESPNGTRYRTTVDNTGTLITTSI